MKHGFQKGCSYQIKTGGRTLVARVQEYNPVDRYHAVTVDGRTVRMDLSKATVRRRRAASKKTSTRDVYLYLCELGGGLYKIGVSASPQRREKQIKTYSGKAKMRTTARIPSHKSAAFRSFEKAVLERFAHGRTSGGTEVLRLSAKDVTDCSSFMRSICARA